MTDQEKPAQPDGAATPPPQRHKVWFALRTLLRTRIVAGLLTVVPIWVTWVVIKFVFDTMRSATEPIAWWFAQRVQEGAQPVAMADAEKLAMQAEVVREAVTRLVESDPQSKMDPTNKALIVDEIVRKLNYLLDQVPGASAGVLSESTLIWLVPVLAVLLTLFLLYLLGLLTASVFGRRLIQLVERIFTRLPLVKTIYNSTKQIVTSLGGGQSMNFQRVVLVEFPHPGMKCIGFLTAVMDDMDSGRKMASVFISTTPNPTTGYMQIVPLQDVSDTGWTVEEAVKLLMSGGILSPTKVAFDKIHPVHWNAAAPAPSEPQGRASGRSDRKVQTT